MDDQFHFSEMNYPAPGADGLGRLMVLAASLRLGAGMRRIRIKPGATRFLPKIDNTRPQSKCKILPSFPSHTGKEFAP